MSLRVGSNGEDGGSSLESLGGDEGRAIMSFLFSDARREVVGREEDETDLRRVIRRDQLAITSSARPFVTQVVG
jgi:hypothetical protein